jgi:hypothetical protein
MRTTAEETSGPMPSPGMSVIVCAIVAVGFQRSALSS